LNAQEFSDRVRACTPKLWRISWLILRNGADCDDALQEALLRAWRSLPALREESFFETWLTRILIRESNRILGKRGRRTEAEAAAPLPAQPESEAVRDALSELPDAERIAVGLHYMEGYKQKEIAALLGVPETVIKWRLRSGRKHLKQLLEGDDNT